MQYRHNEKQITFLCASPSFIGPIFEESVVIMLESDSDGALGVIINKPTGQILSELKPEFRGSLIGECEVFDGGPLGKNQLSLGVCYLDEMDEPVFEFGIPSDRMNEILDSGKVIQSGAFVGYSSWGPGQLNEEIDEGVWIEMKADTSFLAPIRPEQQWEAMCMVNFPEFKDLKPDFDVSKLSN